MNARDQQQLEVNRALFGMARAGSYEDRTIEYNFNTEPFSWHTSIACQRIAQNARVVGIGSGTGELERQLAIDGLNRTIIGTDLSPEMIDVGNQKSAHLLNVRFEVRDALALGFPDATFDVAVMRGSLHHFPRPIEALREARRVLNSSGELHILDVYSYENPRADELFNRTNVMRQPANFRFYAPSQVNRMCQEAGFEVIDAVSHTITFDLDRWLGTYKQKEAVSAIFLGAAQDVQQLFNLRPNPEGGYLIDFNSFYLVASAGKGE